MWGQCPHPSLLEMPFRFEATHHSDISFTGPTFYGRLFVSNVVQIPTKIFLQEQALSQKKWFLRSRRLRGKSRHICGPVSHSVKNCRFILTNANICTKNRRHSIPLYFANLPHIPLEININLFTGWPKSKFLISNDYNSETKHFWPHSWKCKQISENWKNLLPHKHILALPI